MLKEKERPKLNRFEEMLRRSESLLK